MGEAVENQSESGVLVVGTGSPDLEVHLTDLRWHLVRYDQLRASTTNRAGAVLAAGSILSTGNAVILAQLLLGFGAPVQIWILTGFSIAIVLSSTLVVISLNNAMRVLVTRRTSREMFAQASDVPLSFVFNGSDTVANIATFTAFERVLDEQTPSDVVRAARVELWIVINQHRYRYRRLRRAVGTLVGAAAAFLMILMSVVLANLTARVLGP
jgi:hypothetical protein